MKFELTPKMLAHESLMLLADNLEAHGAKRYEATPGDCREHFGVAIHLRDGDLRMSIDKFADAYLKPAMQVLARNIMQFAGSEARICFDPQRVKLSRTGQHLVWDDPTGDVARHIWLMAEEEYPAWNDHRLVVRTAVFAPKRRTSIDKMRNACEHGC